MASRPAVRASEDGRWKVVVDGHSRAVAWCYSVDAAVSQARDLFGWAGPVTAYNQVGKVMRTIEGEAGDG